MTDRNTTIRCPSSVVCRPSIDPRRSAAVDGDRHALDLPRAFRAQEQRERRDVLGLGNAADAAARQDLLAYLLDRLARRLRALRPQPRGPLGLGGAGMDRVDVDAVALAQLRQALAEGRHSAVDGAADQEVRLG